MQIEIKKRARNEILSIVEYGKNMFGERIAIDYYYKMKDKILNLSENPELGSPEPLLSNRSIKYRSLIIGKNHKAIYTIKENKDLIEIVDIWDMRREPTSLSRRIKSK